MRNAVFCVMGKTVVLRGHFLYMPGWMLDIREMLFRRIARCIREMAESPQK